MLRPPHSLLVGVRASAHDRAELSSSELRDLFPAGSVIGPVTGETMRAAIVPAAQWPGRF